MWHCDGFTLQGPTQGWISSKNSSTQASKGPARTPKQIVVAARAKVTRIADVKFIIVLTPKGKSLEGCFWGFSRKGAGAGHAFKQPVVGPFDAAIESRS